MPTTEFRFAPQGETLAQYLADNNRCSLIMGPLGSGKTTATCEKIFKIMCAQAPNAQGVRPSRFVAIRNTYGDLMNTTVKDWLELCGDLGRFTQGGMEPPKQKLDFMLEDGTRVQAEIIFLALDRQDSVKKLRGFQVTGFWLNEAKELDKAIVDMADARHGRYPSMAAGGVKPSWHGMVGDTNAPDDDNWYYQMAEETRPEGWSFHRQPGGVLQRRVGGQLQFYANPDAENRTNLPEGYYERLIAGKASDWILVNLCNEYGYVQDGKPVYPEFRDSFHVRDVGYDLGLALHIGMDFGLTPAATFTQRSAMGQVRVIDELVATRLGAKNFAREIKQLINERYPQATIGTITGDPAGNQGSQLDENQTVFTMLASEGIEALPAESNDFQLRRESVADLLTRSIDGEPALVISPRCRTLRKGMAGAYCFKRVQVTGRERYHDKPDKNHYSHVCEALQYGCMGLGISREAVLRPQAQQQHIANLPKVAVMEYNPFA